MATAEATKTREVYKSGFAKKMHRPKHNLQMSERLKAARNRKKLSVAGVVKGLAKKDIVIGQSTLTGYETDETSLNHRYPSLPVLMALAEFYGCSLDYLFGVTDRFKPQSLPSKELDMRDVIESRNSVTYNGIKLNKKQREAVLEKLDMILGELV